MSIIKYNYNKFESLNDLFQNLLNNSIVNQIIQKDENKKYYINYEKLNRFFKIYFYICIHNLPYDYNNLSLITKLEIIYYNELKINKIPIYNNIIEIQKKDTYFEIVDKCIEKLINDIDSNKPIIKLKNYN
jgi:hypothetical protein